MTRNERIGLAKTSLLGVSIGDAFGESFFGNESAMLDYIAQRLIPKTTWEFTDDTVMSLAVFEELEKHGHIDPDQLTHSFVKNHNIDPLRGYGATARRVLREIDEGKDWEIASKEVFDGMGSMGNGAAMRSTCIGAYFYDDLQLVKSNAEKSALVTHANQEAICGAMSTAIAASLATQIGLNKTDLKGNDFINTICDELPDCDIKSKIRKGTTFSKSSHPQTLISVLGNGTKIIAQDTVPISIWMAAHYLDNFAEALWNTVGLLGDRDTLCAIVGGITILSARRNTIPDEWVRSVEDFETSPFRTSCIK